MTRIYLDVCCLNRPFDDQSQDRIRLESEAVRLILTRIEAAELEWIGSELLAVEIEQTPDLERQRRVLLLVRHVDELVTITEKERQRANKLQGLGFRGFDALHLACAESGRADVFLTTDDKVLRRGKRLAAELTVRVANPLAWFQEMIR
jgi:hypothetical protein